MLIIPSKKIIEPQKGAQTAFMCSPAIETFTGGEAGGGKSWALLHDFLRDIKNPDANGIIFRRTSKDFEDLLHKAIQHFRGFNPVFNSQKSTFIFPSGARFRFSHLQHVKDIYSHNGHEYSSIYWDELPQFPILPYTFMMGRLRSVNPTIRKRVRSTGNPVGEGMLWVKDRFIRKLKPYEIGWFKTIGNRDTRVEKGTLDSVSRCWIPTKRSENIALMKNDRTYEAMLSQLPESLQKAMKFGSWETQDRDGQLIHSEWWENAISGANEVKDGVHAIGADYAVSGDRCATCVGVGNSVTNFKSYAGMDTSSFAQIVYKLHGKNGKFRTLTGIDANGPGVGAYQELKKTDIGSYVIAMMYKDKDFDKDMYSKKMHFDNWRSQAWWKFKEDMEFGRIDLSPLTRKEGYFEDLFMLQEEVLAHSAVQGTNKFQVISKQRLKLSEHLGRSPDLADALVMWNWVRERQHPKKMSKFQMNKDIDYEPLEIIGNNPYNDDGEIAWT